MDIIVVSHTRGRTWRVKLAPGNILAWLPLALGVFAVCSLSFFTGYLSRGESSVIPSKLVGAWSKEVREQRAELAKARESAVENTQAFSRRIAQLQSHIMRLDAAGQRLTEIAGLEAGEFDFSAPPPVGGPEVPASGELLAGDPVLASLDAFERRLSDRERQMRVLEDLLLAGRLQKQVRPSGWPIENGYISSLFGLRSDPFSGRTAMHEGMDFAGPVGSEVMAVAAGIVTDAGDREHEGYGKLVEINHGNGYVTRYGHNSSLAVKIGDRVIKGQTIARIGNTGRSTGPHVHFEVLLNGKVVNPERYIEAAR